MEALLQPDLSHALEAQQQVEAVNAQMRELWKVPRIGFGECYR